MTEKQLHKLHRQDLLQLLLAQSREVASEQAEINSLRDRVAELEAGNKRLTGKLDERDATVERLRSSLEQKDALLEKLVRLLDQKDADVRALREGGLVELPGDGDEAGYVAVRLEELFTVARRAAADYLRQKARAATEAAEAVSALPAGERPEPREAAAEHPPGDVDPVPGVPEPLPDFPEPVPEEASGPEEKPETAELTAGEDET